MDFIFAEREAVSYTVSRKVLTCKVTEIQILTLS